MYVGFEWVVIRAVSTQPPWSMAMSMITEPGRIERTICRVTSFGARAPGISTVPITTSVSRTRCSSVSRSDMSVMIRPLWIWSMYRSLSRLLSRTTTSASMPAAIQDAVDPAIPAPSTSTFDDRRPHRLGRGDDLGPGPRVALLRDVRTVPGAVLDQDPVPCLGELPRALGRERHPELVVLHLFRDPDDHRSSSPSGGGLFPESGR